MKLLLGGDAIDHEGASLGEPLLAQHAGANAGARSIHLRGGPNGHDVVAGHGQANIRLVALGLVRKPSLVAQRGALGVKTPEEGRPTGSVLDGQQREGRLGILNARPSNPNLIAHGGHGGHRRGLHTHVGAGDGTDRGSISQEATEVDVGTLGTRLQLGHPSQGEAAWRGGNGRRTLVSRRVLVGKGDCPFGAAIPINPLEGNARHVAVEALGGPNQHGSPIGQRTSHGVAIVARAHRRKLPLGCTERSVGTQDAIADLLEAGPAGLPNEQARAIGEGDDLRVLLLADTHLIDAEALSTHRARGGEKARGNALAIAVGGVVLPCHDSTGGSHGDGGADLVPAHAGQDEFGSLTGDLGLGGGAQSGKGDGRCRPQEGTASGRLCVGILRVGHRR